jgi:hypothetical protein
VDGLDVWYRDGKFDWATGEEEVFGRAVSVLFFCSEVAAVEFSGTSIM